MLTAKALSYALPDGRVLFQNLNFTIESKRYGLVGVNGVGKSTLVKILSGELAASEGRLIGESKVTYLPQWQDRPATTAGEYLVDIWESTDTFIREGLLGDIDLSAELKILSGGQWMRVRLLKALAEKQDILVVDEPTNDLDREARRVLYQFVKDYRGSLVMISHDRELLSHVDGILELTNQGLAFYGGGFAFYEEIKKTERERLILELDVARREKKKQEREHAEKIEKQVKRSRLAEKKAPDMGLPRIIIGGRKRQAQVSLGKIHKHEQERDQQRSEEFQKLYEKQKNTSEMRLNFSLNGKPKGKLIFSVDGFNFRYRSAEDFLWPEDLTFTLYSQDRLALKGGNGTGKTTLLKVLTREMSSLLGETRGHASPITRNFVYLDQGYGLLNQNETVLGNAIAKSRLDQTEVRNKLADFGFTGESVFKFVSQLSGGERLKLSLAMLLFCGGSPELWILDEPTNNLDLESLSILERTLREFEGTLIVVSHDEIFLEKIGCGQELVLCQQKKS